MVRMLEVTTHLVLLNLPKRPELCILTLTTEGKLMMSLFEADPECMFIPNI